MGATSMLTVPMQKSSASKAQNDKDSKKEGCIATGRLLGLLDWDSESDSSSDFVPGASLPAPAPVLSIFDDRDACKEAQVIHCANTVSHVENDLFVKWHLFSGLDNWQFSVYKGMSIDDILKNIA